MSRQSDTKGLTGQLGAARLKTADEYPEFARGSADLAVQKPQQADYDRAYGTSMGCLVRSSEPRTVKPAPGVGSESLSAAKAALK